MPPIKVTTGHGVKTTQADGIRFNGDRKDAQECLATKPGRVTPQEAVAPGGQLIAQMTPVDQLAKAVWMQKANPAEAKAYCMEVLNRAEVPFVRAQARICIGKILIAEGKFDEAFVQFREAAVESASSAGVSNMAALYRRTGIPRRELSCLAKAGNNRQDTDAFALTKHAESVGMFPSAEDLMRLGLLAACRYRIPPACEKLGQIYRAEGRMSDAIFIEQLAA